LLKSQNKVEKYQRIPLLVESLLEKLNGVCLSFVFCHINKEKGHCGGGGEGFGF